MRLILARHPKPVVEAGVCYGRLDLDCDAREVDAALARLMPHASDAVVYTSPARRCRDLSLRLNPVARIEPRLQELDFGAWEGVRWDAIAQSDFDAWANGLPNTTPPGGEALAAMAARLSDWLADMSRDHAAAEREPFNESGGRPAPAVLAITHAGPIRVLRALAEGLPLLTHFAQPVPYGEAIALDMAKLGL
ncbi:histidine phosphatase family protein [Rhodomicrobium vannielii ATCC 17100]|uniref:histidine phosphatase family protein n=1 Tax=Rhodomicrobium vannielii TaxID=1069 RepID=UPI00191B7E53|nr:histidine phosphatase family protein [Rhodomicrobium vannielii]MBJ7534952.1 histidine phosphatase family protein [Rhodomicrobium vannielii ATCC 17100]